MLPLPISTHIEMLTSTCLYIYAVPIRIHIHVDMFALTCICIIAPIYVNPEVE